MDVLMGKYLQTFKIFKSIAKFFWVVKSSIIAILFTLLSFWSSICYSQPPYLTSSPVPLEYLETDLYFFSMVDKGINSTDGVQGLENTVLTFPAFCVEYGATSNLTLHLLAPFTNNIPKGDTTYSGIGDFEIGFLYRFIEESENCPEIGFFPLVELPSGNSNKGLGNGKLWYELPLAVKKTLKSLELDLTASGGPALNSGFQMKNFWFASVLLEKKMNDKLKLGAEVYSQGSAGVGRRAYTLLNVGGWYDFTPNFSLYFSLGNTFIGERHLIGALGLFWKFEGKKTTKMKNLN